MTSDPITVRFPYGAKAKLEPLELPAWAPEDIGTLYPLTDKIGLVRKGLEWQALEYAGSYAYHTDGADAAITKLLESDPDLAKQLAAANPPDCETMAEMLREWGWDVDVRRHPLVRIVGKRVDQLLISEERDPNRFRVLDHGNPPYLPREPHEALQRARAYLTSLPPDEQAKWRGEPEAAGFERLWVASPPRYGKAQAQREWAEQARERGESVTVAKPKEPPNLPQLDLEQMTRERDQARADADRMYHALDDIYDRAAEAMGPEPQMSQEPARFAAGQELTTRDECVAALREGWRIADKYEPSSWIALRERDGTMLQNWYGYNHTSIDHWCSNMPYVIVGRQPWAEENVLPHSTYGVGKVADSADDDEQEDQPPAGPPDSIKVEWGGEPPNPTHCSALEGCTNECNPPPRQIQVEWCGQNQEWRQIIYNEERWVAPGHGLLGGVEVARNRCGPCYTAMSIERGTGPDPQSAVTALEKRLREAVGIQSGPAKSAKPKQSAGELAERVTQRLRASGWDAVSATPAGAPPGVDGHGGVSLCSVNGLTVAASVGAHGLWHIGEKLSDGHTICDPTEDELLDAIGDWIAERPEDVAGQWRFREAVGSEPSQTVNLDAPCLFCGYHGEGYWQTDTHHIDCPWHSVGGSEARRARITTVLATKLDTPEPAAAPSHLPDVLLAAVWLMSEEFFGGSVHADDVVKKMRDDPTWRIASLRAAGLESVLCDE